MTHVSKIEMYCKQVPKYDLPINRVPCLLLEGYLLGIFLSPILRTYFLCIFHLRNLSYISLQLSQIKQPRRGERIVNAMRYVFRPFGTALLSIPLLEYQLSVFDIQASCRIADALTKQVVIFAIGFVDYGCRSYLCWNFGEYRYH